MSSTGSKSFSSKCLISAETDATCKNGRSCSFKRSSFFQCLPSSQFTSQIHWPPLRVEYDQQLAHARVRAWALGTRKISCSTNGRHRKSPSFQQHHTDLGADHVEIILHFLDSSNLVLHLARQNRNLQHQTIANPFLKSVMDRNQMPSWGSSQQKLWQ